MLDNDDEGIKSIEEDQELIGKLHADLLLESPDKNSQKIARAFGQVFLSRPTLFPDRTLISQNPKMFETRKSSTKKKARPAEQSAPNEYGDDAQK